MQRYAHIDLLNKKTANDAYVETLNECFQVREKFFHCVLLRIECKIFGGVMKHARHLFVHAFQYFQLLLGGVQKLVKLGQENLPQLL